MARPGCGAPTRTAYVAGEPFLWPALTGAETLAYLAKLREGTDTAYRGIIERFQLDIDKKVRALSKGSSKEVQLIAAFASRADLLILDEPTSGLDPLMEVAFRETVREAKGAARRCSSRRTSSARSRPCAIGSASCARPPGRTGRCASCVT